MIFSGAPHFFDKFKQSATNRKIGMPELYSRIGYSHYMKKPTKNEIEAICRANNIEDEESIKNSFLAQNFRVLSSFIKNKNIGLI